MLLKQKIPSLRSWDFWQIANSILNKGISSASDKAKLFAKNVSKNCNHDGKGVRS